RRRRAAQRGRLVLRLRRRALPADADHPPGRAARRVGRPRRGGVRAAARRVESLRSIHRAHRRRGHRARRHLRRRACVKVLMTADTVGGVWTYATELARALPDVTIVLAAMGGPIPGDVPTNVRPNLRDYKLDRKSTRLNSS